MFNKRTLKYSMHIPILHRWSCRRLQVVDHVHVLKPSVTTTTSDTRTLRKMSRDEKNLSSHDPKNLIRERELSIMNLLDHHLIELTLDH